MQTPTPIQISIYSSANISEKSDFSARSKSAIGRTILLSESVVIVITAHKICYHG